MEKSQNQAQLPNGHISKSLTVILMRASASMCQVVLGLVFPRGVPLLLVDAMLTIMTWWKWA